MIRLFAAQERERTRKKSLTNWLGYCNRSIVQPSPEQSMPTGVGNWSARWPSSLVDCADDQIVAVAAVIQRFRRCIGVSGVGPGQLLVFLGTRKQRKGP